MKTVTLPVCSLALVVTFFTFNIAIISFAAEPSAQSAAEQPILGFLPSHVAAQRKLEAEFTAELKPENQKAVQAHLAARPHHVGSAYNANIAEFLLAQYKAWGFDAHIETFTVLFPTPKTRVLEMTEPHKFVASLAEPALKEDSTSGQTDEQLPTYNCYSTDGDVTGDLVYVNYGTRADYETLKKNGVDVKGKIVIARYGEVWRGIKPKVAGEHGAIGCIIYSDPRDDGYFKGDVYPKGGYRMDHSVQRGSVGDHSLYTGDPLTPGIGATEGAPRLAIKDAPSITKIPVLPISYADAQPLLAALDGPVAPEEWRGALPITYHLGPGPAKVHLKLEFNWDMQPIRDIIARLAGSERPDELILRGNHYDAWVNGADDPLSGQVALLEEARSVGLLAKSGWRPKRTIVYCSWDGEEPGLLGSTEYVETHAAELVKQAVAYINSDGNGRGFLRIGGSHTLEKFINQVARDVKDPETGVSVWKRAQARKLAGPPPEGSHAARERAGASTETGRAVRERADLRIEALGSGSDYTPFLQHLGIASLNLGFGGEGGGGSYHSIYDSIDHFQRFIDPGNIYGAKLAETAGRATLRLADADVLPFDFKGLADTIGVYEKEVIELADKMREETEANNKLITDGTLKLIADPTKPFVVPATKTVPPHFNFAPLENALDELKKAADDYEAAVAKLPAGGLELDQALIQSERTLTREEGLPKRPWYKHYIYAPGAYAGYDTRTLPAVREALELRQWSIVNDNIAKTAATIKANAEQIKRAAALAR